MTRVDQLVSRAHRRMAVGLVVQGVGRMALCGASAGVLAVLVARVVWNQSLGAWWWVLGAGMAGAAIGAVRAIRLAPDRLNAAMEIDRRLLAAGRISNAWELRARALAMTNAGIGSLRTVDDPAFADLAFELGARRASSVGESDRVRRATPIRFGWEWGALPAALALGILLAGWMPGLDALGLGERQQRQLAERQSQREVARSIETSIRAVQHAASVDRTSTESDTAIERRVADLESLRRELESGSKPSGSGAEAAARTLHELAAKVEGESAEAARRQEALADALRNAGGPSRSGGTGATPTSGVNRVAADESRDAKRGGSDEAAATGPESSLTRALRRGDLAGAAEAVREANTNSAQSDDERARLIEDLRRLADDLNRNGQRGTPEGSETNEHASTEPAHGSPSASSDAPDAAPDRNSAESVPPQNDLKAQDVPPETARRLEDEHHDQQRQGQTNQQIKELERTLRNVAQRLKREDRPQRVRDGQADRNDPQKTERQATGSRTDSGGTSPGRLSRDAGQTGEQQVEGKGEPDRVGERGKPRDEASESGTDQKKETPSSTKGDDRSPGKSGTELRSGQQSERPSAEGINNPEGERTDTAHDQSRSAAKPSGGKSADPQQREGGQAGAEKSATGAPAELAEQARESGKPEHASPRSGPNASGESARPQTTSNRQPDDGAIPKASASKEEQQGSTEKSDEGTDQKQVADRNSGQRGADRATELNKPTPSSMPGAEGRAEQPSSQGTDQPGALGELIKAIDKLQKPGQTAQERQQLARDLRRSAEEIMENATPEQRQRWQQMAKEMAKQGAGDIARKSDRQSSERGSRNSTVGSGAGLGPRHESNSPFSTGGHTWRSEVVDARPSEQRATVQDDEKVVAEWMGDGVRTTGSTGTAEAVSRVRAAAGSAEKAIEQGTVSSRYERLLRRYFDRLPQRVQERGSATPAPAAKDSE